MKKKNAADKLSIQTTSGEKIVLAEENILRLSPDAYDAFAKLFDEPPRDLPQLRALFAERSLLDG